MRPRPPPIPRSSRQPAPLARRAWRPPAGPLRASSLVFRLSWVSTGDEAAADGGPRGPPPAAAPAPRAPSPQLTADTSRPWRRANGCAPQIRRRCRLARTGPDGKTRPGTQRPPSPCSDPRGKVSCASPRVEDGVQGTWWRPGVVFGVRGEARCCCPHVTASGKMALAEERTERQLDARSARVAAGEGCVHPPGPRRGPSREIWKAPKCPLSAKSDPGPPAHRVSPGFRRRHPVNPSFPVARGPSEGAQDGCRIPAGLRAGTEGRRWLQAGPETRGAHRRLCSPSSPLPQRGQVAVRHPDPHLLCRVPCRRESLHHGNPGVPRFPGPGRRSLTGL